MVQKKPDNNQTADGLEGEGEISDMDNRPVIEIDPQKVEKARTELKVLKEYLKKQQSQKNNTNQRERRQ